MNVVSIAFSPHLNIINKVTIIAILIIVENFRLISSLFLIFKIEDFLNRDSEYGGDIHGKLQRGVVFAVFQIHNRLPPDSNKIRKVLLSQAIGIAIIFYLRFQQRFHIKSNAPFLAIGKYDNSQDLHKKKVGGKNETDKVPGHIKLLGKIRRT